MSDESEAPAPLISATVTNYNYARFLPRTIESILGQTFTDFELVLIDNASTDGSIDVMRRYAAQDQRIRIIAHAENQGALASLRQSCDVARGKYRVQVDADDWVMSPRAFEDQVELLEKHPEVVFVYSSMTMFGPDENKTLVSRPYPRDVILPGELALEAILNFNLTHSGMMIRLDAYHRSGGYPAGMPHTDDMLLAVRLCELGHVAYIDRELYAFRQHGGNVHLAPQLPVLKNEILPVIDAAFEGPLGPRVPNSEAVRRGVVRNALLHLPTQYIFSGKLRMGWRLYWESVKVRPADTVFQPRTLSLIARTVLRARGYDRLAAPLLERVRHGSPQDESETEATRASTDSDDSARFVFISPSGWGNLGDAAIIDSLIHGIRERVPNASVGGYTLNPADTRGRHDVDEAHGISSFSTPYYPLADDPVGAEAGPTAYAPASGSMTPETEQPDRTMHVRHLLRRNRVVRSVGDLVLAAARLRHEPKALRDLFERLAGTSAVVVAGGGQLDGQFGGFFGQPYVLWRWARTARRIGARFLVLSVGTGTLDRPSRRLCVRALRRADYRSYRDEASRALLLAPELTGRDPIVPDLAYAVPRPAPPLPEHERMVVVGVSPMNYQHPEFHPDGKLERYEQYIDAMVVTCTQLLEDGCEVVVFITDGSDAVASRDLARRLELLDDALRSRVRVAESETVSDLWATYAAVDVVVATRLHAALLAHVAHRPTLALGHERKVRALMADVGHDRYSLDIDGFEGATAAARLRELIADRHALSRQLGAAVDDRRARVEAQYDVVFGQRLSPEEPGRAT